jgi:REP-associated tyrosine transposase
MHRRRPRWRAFNYIGRYRYFLTFATHDRRPVFMDSAIVERTLSQILKSAAGHQFAITAYCFMPDHVHLLVAGRADNADLQRFVKSAKQTSGYIYCQATGAQLWQPSYYDHVLRDDESSLFVIAYILRNPVVAGLVNRCEEYCFLGSPDLGLENLFTMLREGLGPNWETRPGICARRGMAGLKACATDRMFGDCPIPPS